MSLNWENLRPWDGSQRIAFEELCCQLARCQVFPEGSLFIRKGTPDAGAECFWRLPNDAEHCWQAKFFLSSPDSNQWSQIDDSVKTVLAKHPNITKYTICLPMDRPDAREEGKKSCLQKWDDHVASWQKLAKEKGMVVEFLYWGESEIFQMLSKEEHRGRYLFWFNRDILTNMSMSHQIDDAISNVGPRYTPELNVELEIAELFDAMGRNDKYHAKIRELLGKLQRRVKSLARNKQDVPFYETVSNIIKKCQKLFSLLFEFSKSPECIVDMQNLKSICSEVNDLIWECHGSIHDLEEKEYEEKFGHKRKGDYYSSEYSSWNYNLRMIREAIGNLRCYVDGSFARLSILPNMILCGDAGTGKTHLLCDIALNRINNNMPTVLLLGQHFRNANPWKQIIDQLQFHCETADEMLGILDAAGEASHVRTLIFLDAINESYDKEFWTDHLTGIFSSIRRYKWVGIVVSIRQSYLNYIIPAHLLNDSDLVSVAFHQGFKGVEYEAFQKFFTYYKIDYPSVPLLNPEFLNPLFLKLLCEGLCNLKIKQFPRDFHNITKIYETFVNSIDKKLSRKKYLDYNLNERIVWKSVNLLAGVMATKKRQYLTEKEVEFALEDLDKSTGYHNSLYSHLKSEHLICEDMAYHKELYIDVIRFAYERFTDHLIAKFLIDKYIGLSSPNESFRKASNLTSLFSDEQSLYYNRGVIEALSIQIPERYGVDLHSLVPKHAGKTVIKEAFLESLIWRDPNSITKKCDDYINSHISKEQYLYDRLIDIYITVATLENHPFNIDFFHKRLLRSPMPKRDVAWSNHIYYQDEGDPAYRLVNWAMFHDDKKHITDESVLRASKMLAWFLTTSQRFLRDRATKAMVNLLTDRMHLIKQLLIDFNEVDDLYIKERLYAIAYGCAMRSTSDRSLKEMSQYVYDTVFSNSKPYPHILLRDYARNIVELALCRNIEIKCDKDKIRPPYQSKWPDNIPSKKDLEKKYDYRSKDDSLEYKALRSIYWQVTNDLSDFNKYKVRNTGWSSIKFGKCRKITQEDRYNVFIASLTERQKTAFDKYKDARSEAISIALILHVQEEKLDNIETGETEDKPDKLVTLTEKKFLRTLGKQKTLQYHQEIVPYLENPTPERYDFFDNSITEAYIFNRILELGWSPSLHYEFDKNKDMHYTLHDSHRPEKLSEKYQWIALYEFLAYLCDHYEYGNQYSDDDNKYEGPWQGLYRDIDPSYLNENSPKNVMGDCLSLPIINIDWEQYATNKCWVSQEGDMPDFKGILQVNGCGERKWLLLDGYYNFMEPHPPEEEPYEKYRKNMWFMIHSYFVRKSDTDTLFAWLKKQNFMDLRMPERGSGYGDIFLGEYFWSPAFNYYNRPYYGRNDWIKSEDHFHSMPVDVLLTTDIYSREGANYDCSINDSVSVVLPEKSIVDALSLSWKGAVGKWYNTSDELVAFPPMGQQPSLALQFRQDVLMDYLDKNDLDLVWYLLGEKRVIGGNHNFYDRQIINGAFRIFDNQLLDCYNIIHQKR